MVALTKAAADDNDRDARIEKLLGEAGVEYEFVIRFNLALIDRAKSRRNQARVGEALNEDQVLVYATAMERGDHFPPIIVAVWRGKPMAVSAGGNHRVGALDLLGVKSHPAYVVNDPTPAQFLRIAYLDNDANSLALSLTDRLEQAAHLMATMGLSQKDAAAMRGVPAAKLGRHMAEKDAKSRAARLGVRLPRMTSPILRAQSIRSDKVFAPALELADLVPTDEFDTIVTAINRAPSEDDALSIIAGHRARVVADRTAAAGLVGPRKRTPLERLSTSANYLTKLPGEEEVRSIPAPMQPLIRKRLVSSIEALEQVVSWLDR